MPANAVLLIQGLSYTNIPTVTSRGTPCSYEVAAQMAWLVQWYNLGCWLHEMCKDNQYQSTGGNAPTKWHFLP